MTSESPGEKRKEADTPELIFVRTTILLVLTPALSFPLIVPVSSYQDLLGETTHTKTSVTLIIGVGLGMAGRLCGTLTVLRWHITISVQLLPSKLFPLFQNYLS